MLELKRLSAGYGNDAVLHGIDLGVTAGRITALIGANGAGKSTLAKTISGLLPARDGQILFDGARIDTLTPTARVQRGIVHVPEGRSPAPVQQVGRAQGAVGPGLHGRRACAQAPGWLAAPLLRA